MTRDIIQAPRPMKVWSLERVVLCAVVAGALVCVGGLTESWAQMPQTRAQKRKRAVIMAQARCIKGCQDSAYKRFYGCGHDRNLECDIRGWMSFRRCLRGCRAAWFCPGFKRTVGKHCHAMCLRESRQKRKRFCRRKTRKAKRQCLRRYLQWRGRTRHACKHVCKTLFLECSVRIPKKLPPPSRLPQFDKM